MPAKPGYSTLQITLHWLIAHLILAAWFVSDGMERALRERLEIGATGIEGNTLHVWLGGIVFALVLLPLIVRLVQGAPGPLPGQSPLMEAAALWGHRLLYLLMIAAPASGAAAWYGGVKSAGEGHEFVTNFLMIVALGHAAVALWHQFVRRDGTLTRMVRAGAD